MDTKVKGIIIKLSNYKEADKLASIFSFEQGIITAKFTGVKKEKAKFKAVAQPFCFADFVLNTKAGTNTVTSANIIDNFFGITANYNKTICAYIVLDILQSILPKQKEEPEIFVLTIKALKDIEQKNEYISLIDFILQFIKFSGMQVEFDCNNTILLDKDTGNFTSQKSLWTVPIDKKVYNLLKQINDSSEEDDKDATLEKTEYPETVLKQALRLTNNIMLAKFGVELKTFVYI